MKKPKMKNWRLWAVVGLLCQTFGTTAATISAHANEIAHPQNVIVEYDLKDLYHLDGTFSNGTQHSENSLPLFAIYNGVRQPVFCIEPGVPIPNTVTPGYEKNPLPNMSKRQNWSRYYGDTPARIRIHKWSLKK